MERNVHFETKGLEDIVVRLAWAQLEIFADDVDKIQVMAAGDEATVSDLRVGVRDKELVVEQPQYGLSLNITESKWMQVCIRVPRTWDEDIHLSTIGGILSARGLHGDDITLDTVSGDLRAVRVQADKLAIKTISGDVRAEAIQMESLSVRSVSGDLVLDGVSTEELKANSVSGQQIFNFDKAFERIEVNAVSGDVMVTSPVKAVNVSMRSISGRVSTEGVAIAEQEGIPFIRMTGVSANLKLISIQ